MKTPREKAEELVVKYASLQITTVGCTDNSNPCVITNVMFKDNAKQCALIAVDEILNNDGFTQFDIYLTEYWQEVRKEIEAL